MRIFIMLTILFWPITPSFGQTEIKINQNPGELIKSNNGKKVYINDSSLYSRRFIKELQGSIHGPTDSIILINETLHTYSRYNNKAAYYKYIIPDELPLGKSVSYGYDNNGKNYSLSLTRTNLTEIKFDLNINGEKTKTGIAILGGAFYFGAECGAIDEKGEMYCSAQYLSDNYPHKSPIESIVRITVQYGSGEHVSYHEYFSNRNKTDINMIFRQNN